MQTHPDAYAFMRNYLEQPADAVTRLVFADWLEETGEPHNAAWAHFIRLKIEADRHDFGSRERRELDRQADAFTPDIRARLTLSASRFVAHSGSLLQLLPASNITVRIAQFRPSDAAVARVAEDIARTIPILPLDYHSGMLIVAHPVPFERAALSAIRAYLSGGVVVVGAEWAEVVGTLNAVYATATEHAALLDVILADLPSEFETVPGTYPVQNGSDFVDDVLHACARRGADVITFTPQGELVRVYYRTPSGVVEAGRISRGDWTHLVFPEIMRRGEATGTEFTVEVIRNGGERALRIWPSTLMLL